MHQIFEATYYEPSAFQLHDQADDGIYTCTHAAISVKDEKIVTKDQESAFSVCLRE